MCNDEIKIVEQLKEENTLLKEENKIFKASIEELEKRLAVYENAHTPSSLKRGGGNSGKNQKKGKGEKPGQKKGHRGVTRSGAEPDKQVNVNVRSLQPILTAQKRAYSVITR